MIDEEETRERVGECQCQPARLLQLLPMWMWIEFEVDRGRRAGLLQPRKGFPGFLDFSVLDNFLKKFPLLVCSLISY